MPKRRTSLSPTMRESPSLALAVPWTGAWAAAGAQAIRRRTAIVANARTIT